MLGQEPAHTPPAHRCWLASGLNSASSGDDALPLPRATVWLPRGMFASLWHSSCDLGQEPQRMLPKACPEPKQLLSLPSCPPGRGVQCWGHGLSHPQTLEKQEAPNGRITGPGDTDPTPMLSGGCAKLQHVF